MFRIQHIEYLGGLAALPLLVASLWFLLGWKKKTVERIGDPGLVNQLIGSFSQSRFLVKAGLAIIAFAIIILGAGNLQKPGKMENVKRQGVDVMFLLDVSKSMLARDIKPSRLEKAKQLLMLLTEKLENDRLGLVLFAGRAYLQMPLTSDHGAARMYIQDASPDAVPTQGTVIADALNMANSAFNSKERKYKSVLLVSDGEDHDPEALKTAKQLAKDGVMINTVGIGSPEGSAIIDPATGELKKDEQGNTVISKLNEAELQQLADATNGRYIRLDNVDDALITMTQQLENAEKKAMTDAEFVDYISYFQWFIAAAIVLLLTEFFLSERRREPRESRKALENGQTRGTMATQRTAAITTVLLLVAMGMALPSFAQSTNAQIRSGNRYYRKKELDKSVQQYQGAVRQSPGNPTANYNLGNAQFRKNNYDEAAKSYDATVQNSKNLNLKEKGYYNKGVALIKQKKLPESIDSWKQALRLDAADSDARENLEKALIEQKQQQQQQQNQNKQQKEQKDQKKDQKKDQDQQQQPQQQKPQPSRLNKQQVEQLLKALEQKENELQNKMHQNKTRTPNQPDKDW